MRKIVKATSVAVKVAAVSIAAVGLTISTSHAADVGADAGAKIIQGLTITKASDLFFGTVIPSDSNSDTVVVAPDGVKTCGINLVCVTEDHTAASFNVAGQPDAVYTVTLPSTITIGNGGGVTMTVNGVVGSKTSGTLVTGSDNFTVGGTLTVAANQAAGDYTGAFTVTVDYQ